MRSWRNWRKTREHRVQVQPPADGGAVDLSAARRGRLAGLKNRKSVAAGVGLSVLAIVVPMASATPAQAGVSTPVGTWNKIAHPLGLNVPTTISFHIDGTISNILAPAGSFSCPAGTATGTCHLGSPDPSVGLWRPTGNNTFEYTFKEFIFDSNNNLVAFLIPHDHGTLSSDGNSYTETGTTGWFDTQDNLLFTTSASSTATRMQFPSSY